MPDENSAPDPSAAQPNSVTPPSEPGSSFTPQAPTTPSQLQTPPVMVPPEPPKRGKRKLVLIVTVVVLVLLLAAGYAFAFYLPKQPSNMYKAGLTNTGKAIDKLTDYAEQQKSADYKGAEFSGKLHVKSPVVSFDLSASGAADKEGNASVNLEANLMGEKLQGDFRTIKAKGNNTPDIYLKVKNAQKLLGQFGMQKYDDKWIMVDHTILDTYARKAGADSTAKTTAPDSAQLADAMVKLQEVNKTYLFTTDESKAVLTQAKFIGKEKLMHDRTAYHYKVGYNKAHLKTYVAEAKKALDASKLNDWSKLVSGRSIGEQSGFDSLEKSIDNAKGDYQFDLWIDEATRVVNQVRFADPKDAASTFTIAQHYTGSGNVYPFSFGFKGKNANDEPYSGAFDLSLDTKTHKVSMVISGNSKHEGGQTDEISGNFTVTPSNKTVETTAPSGATSINQVMEELLGGMLTTQPTVKTPDSIKDII